MKGREMERDDGGRKGGRTGTSKRGNIIDSTLKISLDHRGLDKDEWSCWSSNTTSLPPGWSPIQGSDLDNPCLASGDPQWGADLTDEYNQFC